MTATDEELPATYEAHHKHDGFHGVEVRGVYDGVLYWVCQAHGLAFAREFQDARRQVSERYARRAQEAMEGADLPITTEAENQ